MKIIINDNCTNDKPGVYFIKNVDSNKVYVGSTTMAVLKRIWHHISLLKTNKHKNIYLQNAFNKYGEDKFEAIIVENTQKSETLNREQYYLDLHKENRYNINPLASGTPNMSSEIIEKRRQTMLRKYISGEIKPIMSRIPWNKGLKSNNFDYSYLKGIKKKVTEKKIKSWEKQGENRRNNSPKVFVYDLNYNFLKEFRCSKDLEEWSLTENNNLPISGRFKTGRRTKPLNYLDSGHINSAIKFKKSYKGLYFSNMPLHQEIDVEKLNKNGEG